MFGIASFAEFAFGESTHQPVNLEGVQATISLGDIATIAANADVTATTNVANISIGDLTFVGAANVTLSGNAYIEPWFYDTKGSCGRDCHH